MAVRRYIQPTVHAALMALLVAAPAMLAGCGGTGEEAPAARPERPAHLVETVTVTPETVSTARDRTGDVRARRKVRIHTREEGLIETLPFFEGDTVGAGETLATIDDSLLRAELAKAEARTRQARLDLERLDGLITKNAASQDELARARTELDVALAEQQILETRIEHTRMKAPFDGIVTRRLMESGDMAAKNDHLLTMVDPQSLVVEAPVSELTLPQLRVGDPATVRIDALGTGVFEGRILRIHPALDPLTRQGIVEIALTPLPEGFREGQFARVTLKTAARERMLVPFSALQRDREGEFLYRLTGEGMVETVRVTSGVRTADRIEILDGIAPGDRIVSRGFLGLRAGMTVRVVGDT